jgi:hypothetical protein
VGTAVEAVATVVEAAGEAATAAAGEAATVPAVEEVAAE